MNKLDAIIQTKHAEVAALSAREKELRAAAEHAAADPSAEARPFARALRQPSVSLIAECKRRSPSAGQLRRELDPAKLARAYAEGGAAALSVLTDREHFGGSLEDLRMARSATRLPVLRKDFLIDPVQLWESRAAGADAVLLIVRVLDDARLTELMTLAGELGLAALAEVHDAPEIERALAAGAEIVGVNNRDLSTFRTDLSVTERLAGAVPPECVLVAESGIASGEDVARVARAGADAVLVGEALVRSGDPAAGARALAGVRHRGRASAGARAAVEP